MKKNIIIVVLVLMVLGFGGYITYDKVLKEKYFDKKEDVIEDNKEESVVEKVESSDERYAKYLKKLENSFDKHFKPLPNVSDDELSKLDEDEYYSYEQFCGATPEYTEDDNNYCINLENKELKIQLKDDYDNPIKIDDSVLNYFVVYYANAGYRMIYYITTEGKIYMVLHENIIDQGLKSFKKEEIKGLKNIVNVIPAKGSIFSGSMEAIFVDIDGNMFNVDGDEVRQLN